ncbi:MAG: amine oxidase [Spirochaeta sp.]|nr:amine oxidase [Spirochaeta sp.]RPG04943.1 MAG: NAD(P)/FAD-dependent oxidoreductase [Proteobacteria bacterium TMED72]
MGTDYDAIVVGGGHNGLVTAAYLARARRSVLVLERRPILGGACVTEEIHPGFRGSTTSYVCSLLRPAVVEELRLREHGFDLLPCDTSFAPFPDGSHLLLGVSEEQDAEQLARLSSRDAEAYPRFNAAMARMAEFIRATLDVTPPDLASPGLGDAFELLKQGLRVWRLSPSDRELFIKVMTLSVESMLDEWFESPKLKANLAGSGTIGIYGGPSTPGTAYVLLHHLLGEAGGEPGAWGFVRGGMGGITQAMASAARSHGATLRTDAAVQRVLIEDGVARGVILESGEEIRSRVVISNADPKRTYLDLVSPTELPSEFRRGIENFRCVGNSGKVNLALSGLPDFSSLPGDGPHLRGSIQICGGEMGYLERAFQDFREGRPSAGPYMEIVIPSTVDDSLCEPGCHVMSISIKYMPMDLAEGQWKDREEELGDLAVDVLSEYAPNMKDIVVGRHVLTPASLEEVYGLTGGNVFHGDMAADQLYSQRPLLGWAQYRAPVRNLYLCGAGAHPGGGVMGAAGRNASREIEKDFRRGRLA